MPLTYTPSTEKIAKSYQRTTRMVPNMGVSSLTVINPGRPSYESDLADSSLLTPLTGMQLASSTTPRRSSKGRSSRRASSRKRRGSKRILSRRISSRRRSSTR
jgi:hypothetical protein